MNAEVEGAVTPDEVASKIEEEESNNDEDNWGEFAGDDATVDTEGINAEVEGAVTLNEAASKTEEEESNNGEDNSGEFAGDDATAGTKVINTEVDEGVTPDEVASKIEEEHNNDEEDWGEFAGDDKVPVNTEVEEAVTPDEVASKIEEEESNRDDDNWGDFTGDEVPPKAEATNSDVEKTASPYEEAFKDDKNRGDEKELIKSEGAASADIDPPMGVVDIGRGLAGASPLDCATKDHYSDGGEQWGDFAAAEAKFSAEMNGVHQNLPKLKLQTAWIWLRFNHMSRMEV